MSGTLVINEKDRLELGDINSSDIALASFSGYLAVTGQIAKEFGQLAGSRINLVAKVVDGVVTGLFDQSLNPQNDLLDTAGTLLSSYAVGAIVNGIIVGGAQAFVAGSAAGPVAAVIGALGGAIVGGILGPKFYNSGETLVRVLSQEIEKFKYSDVNTIYDVTENEIKIENIANNDPNFCKNMFNEFKDLKQDISITFNEQDSLVSYLSKNSASITTTENDTTKQSEYLTLLTTNNKNIKQVEINKTTYDIKNDGDNLAVRNAINDIADVSVLLSHILIQVGEELDIGAQGTYTISSGDTLSEIANARGME